MAKKSTSKRQTEKSPRTTTSSHTKPAARTGARGSKPPVKMAFGHSDIEIGHYYDMNGVLIPDTTTILPLQFSISGTLSEFEMGGSILVEVFYNDQLLQSKGPALGASWQTATFDLTGSGPGGTQPVYIKAIYQSPSGDPASARDTTKSVKFS